MGTSWVRVEGSEPRRPVGVQRVGDADPAQQITITVSVRGRDPDGLAAWLRLLDQTPPGERRYLTREELAGHYGADPADLDRVAAFYRGQGLEVLEQNAARRRVVVRGNARAIGAAFQIGLGA
jgi:kumamolisin